jgi:RND family efflux transporter MFP subunit
MNRARAGSWTKVERGAAAALLLLLALGCRGDKGASGAGTGGSGPPGAAGGAPPAVPVQLAQLQPQPIAQTSEYLARLSSRRSVTLQPQVTGHLRSIEVRPGMVVKEGTLLMQIDPDQVQAQVASLQAAVRSAEAALAYAEQNARRTQGLVKEGLASQEERDQAVRALAEAQAAARSARAQVSAQQTQARYFSIRAPFEGVVGDIPVKVGDLVGPTTPLTTLDENTRLEAYVSVPLEQAQDLNPSTKVQLLDSAGKVLAEGTPSFVASQVDPATQGVLVKIRFENAKGLRTSQFTRARIIWRTEPGLRVPTVAVTRQAGQAYVYVAEGGKDGGQVARQRPVQLGDIEANAYAVTRGLRPGERVVVAGVQKLRDGAPIQPTEARAPTSAP